MIAGRRFQTPKLDGSMCESSEPWMVELLVKIALRKPGTFLDVGVNLGQTLLALKAVDALRRYVGIEPNAACISYTERLISINKLTNCLLIPSGLGTESGIRQLELFHGTTTDSSASVIANFRPGEVISCAKMVAIFPFSEINRAVDLSLLGIIKVDCEGGEADVLVSMQDAIARQRPWLIVEILPCYDAGNVDRIQRQGLIEALLQRVKYTKYRVKKTKVGGLAYLDRIEEIGIHGELENSDYLFVPLEERERLPKELFARVGEGMSDSEPPVEVSRTNM